MDLVFGLIIAIGAAVVGGLVVYLLRRGGTGGESERLMTTVENLAGTQAELAGRLSQLAESGAAAQAQLAAATPMPSQLGCYPFVNDMEPVADGAPVVDGGLLHLNDEPGLGIVPRAGALGEPLAVYE